MFGSTNSTQVTLLIDTRVIDALVARKYLRQTDRSDKDRLRYAIEDCLDRALGLSD